MKSLQNLTFAVISMISLSCRPKSSEPVGTLAADKALPEGASKPVAAKEANRYEFVESEILPHPEDENGFNHLYMGSLDGFDYISVRSNKYKIPSEQLELEHNFPLTEDTTNWIHMRIHFSQVKYENEG